MRIAVLTKPSFEGPEDSAYRLENASRAEQVALSQALQLEQKLDAELVAITVAPPAADERLQELGRTGIETVYRCWGDDHDVEELRHNIVAVAEYLAKAIEHVGCDLLLAGTDTHRWQTSVAPIAAARVLAFPHISEASEIAAADDGKLKVVVPRQPSHLELLFTPPGLVTFSARGKVLDSPAIQDGLVSEVVALTPAEVGFDSEDPLPWPNPEGRPATPSAPRRLADGAELAETLRRLGAASG